MFLIHSPLDANVYGNFVNVSETMKCQFYCQKYSLTCPDSQKNASDIISQISGFNVSPRFAATTASSLLLRLSTRFRTVFMGRFSRSALVRAH